MIAKQIKGKDFYGALSYNQKKVDRGEGSVLETNLTSNRVVMQTKEFNVIRQLKPNLSKAVYHTSLSLPYTDSLSDKEFTNLASNYLEEMGFNDNQYIIYKHTDQDHAHIHIVANRVKFSGDVVSDSQDYKRSQALVRKLEMKYNLTVLKENKESNVLSKGEIEKCLRTGNIPERLQLQQIIFQILANKIPFEDFQRELRKKGISLKFNTSKEGKIMGISFTYKETSYKGSKIHRSLSWNNLKTKLYEQNRNNSTVSEINSGIKGSKKDTTRDTSQHSEISKNNSGESNNIGQQINSVTKEIINKPKFRI